MFFFHKSVATLVANLAGFPLDLRVLILSSCKIIDLAA